LVYCLDSGISTDHKSTEKSTEKVRTKLLPEQKLGAWVIGQSALRDFGAEGIFTDLYSLEYEDGDLQEVGTEEYKVGRDLWLRESGCEPETFAGPCDSKSATQKKSHET
jgi:hypothetical protein